VVLPQIKDKGIRVGHKIHGRDDSRSADIWMKWAPGLRQTVKTLFTV
jgi:hypothetical protein